MPTADSETVQCRDSADRLCSRFPESQIEWLGMASVELAGTEAEFSKPKNEAICKLKLSKLRQFLRRGSSVNRCRSENYGV